MHHAIFDQMQSIRYHNHIKFLPIHSSIQNINKGMPTTRQTSHLLVFCKGIRINASYVLVTKMLQSHSSLATSTSQVNNLVFNSKVWIVSWGEFFLDQALDVIFMGICVVISLLLVIFLDANIMINLAKTTFLHYLYNICKHRWIKCIIFLSD